MPADFDTLNAPLFKQLDLLRSMGFGSAILAGGERIVEGSRMRTPVDEGNLYIDQQAELVTEGTGGRNAGGILIKIGTNLKEMTVRAYAAFVEFGTIKMAAQPFLRPALDEDMVEAYKVIAAKMLELIKNKLGGK